MRRILTCVFAAAFLAGAVPAEQRVIARASGGQLSLNSACLLLGCNVLRGLDDPLGQVFLVTISDATELTSFVTQLLRLPGILNAEVDRLASVAQEPPPIPAALYDSQVASFFGADVRRGYISQPAVQIVRIEEARSGFTVSGTGIVAIIDTGVDPNHPALRSILLPGYDLTRNLSGSASEMGDVSQSTAAVVDGVPPTYVSDNAAAVIDQSTAAVVDQPGSAAFGHGTMVAGVIHLTAPTALLLPIKAFQADGSGYTSDILRGVYRAVRDGARVINMSFSMASPSVEFQRSIDYAVHSGLICVASAGNQGQQATVYPAAWSNVIGVASTTNNDQRSVFSNYGQDLIWVAAPGEGVITTYPYGTYAAAWGTSFSAPLVAGTAALLLDAQGNLNQSSAATAIGQAQSLGPELGRGRLDVFQAVEAARIMQ